MATTKDQLRQQLEQLNQKSQTTDREVDKLLKRSDRVLERLQDYSTRRR